MHHSLSNIQRLIDEENVDKAISCLDHYISLNGDNMAEALFMRGRAYWRLQEYGPAITDFEKAVALDPDCGAQAALDLARDVLNFYNKDMYNP